ncbi:hypothetical protein B0H14DRAFT_2560456 [Mycena olivaceomarginata]|nr:hypothetical protein B0H14DRAFT_2560456 [Mycena olivaceomarginata]
MGLRHKRHNVDLRQSASIFSVNLAPCSVNTGARSVNPVSVSVSPRQSSAVTQLSSVAVVVIPDNRIWKAQRSKSFGVVDDDEHGKIWLKNQKKKANKAVRILGYPSEVICSSQNDPPAHMNIGATWASKSTLQAVSSTKGDIQTAKLQW